MILSWVRGTRGPTSVSRRSTTSVRGHTLFSSEGILGRELADGDEEQSLIGICRSDPTQIHKKCLSDDHPQCTPTSKP